MKRMYFILFFLIVLSLAKAAVVANPNQTLFFVDVRDGTYHPRDSEKEENPLFINDYYTIGCNEVGEQNIIITHAKDKRIGRIKTQKVYLDINQTPIFVVCYYYEDSFTEVLDAPRHKTIYYFHKHQVETKESYIADDQGQYHLYSKEKFGYIRLNAVSPQTLSFHSLYDAKGTCIAHHQYTENNQSHKTTLNSLSPIGNTHKPLSSIDHLEDHLSNLAKILLGDTLYWLSTVECNPVSDIFFGEKKREIEGQRITYINGILNEEDDIELSLDLISKGHNGQNVHFIYRGTFGWTRDMINSTLARLGFVSENAQNLAILWKKLIEDMGGVQSHGRIIHYAHSIGGTETLCAKKLLTPEEQQKIWVITFGSATMIPNEGFHKTINYVSYRDGVSQVVDPLRYFPALFSKNTNIVFVGTPIGYPFIDHLFDMYWAYWVEHAEEDMGIILPKEENLPIF